MRRVVRTAEFTRPPSRLLGYLASADAIAVMQSMLPCLAILSCYQK